MRANITGATIPFPTPVRTTARNYISQLHEYANNKKPNPVIKPPTIATGFFEILSIENAANNPEIAIAIVIEPIAIPTKIRVTFHSTLVSLTRAITIAREPNEKVQNMLIKKGIRIEILRYRFFALDSSIILSRF